MILRKYSAVFMMTNALCFVPLTAHSTLVDLGTLGGDVSVFRGVSAEGGAVVGNSRLVGGGFRAFKYTSDDGMIDLGTLGGTISAASAVSSDGTVIVGYSNLAGDFQQHAFKHTNGGGMIDLGTLGGISSAAAVVSANGSVIAGNSSLVGGDVHGFKYTDGGGMIDLGTLGGDYSYANAVSANGTVIVGNSRLVGGSMRGFKYTDGGGMIDLGTLGGDYTYAFALSDNGTTIVGYSTLVGEYQHAFKHTDDGGMVDLGTLGGTSSAARGVSYDGAIVIGGSKLVNGYQHAFKHIDGAGMIDLGTLGGNYSYANAVSANGTTIVGYSDLVSGSRHAIKYTDDDGMIDLGTLGGDYSTADAVSSDGSVIVGSSRTATGENHTFIIKTIPPAVIPPDVTPPDITPPDVTPPAVGPMVDVDNTYIALAKNEVQLNSILNLQRTLLSNALNYDCTVFGNNNGCVAVGGGYSRMNGPKAALTGLNLRLGYLISPEVRVGLFLDQRVDDNLPSNYNLKSSQPMMGGFVAWSAQPNDLGSQVKASLVYSTLDTEITRTALSHTEAGKGKSSIDGMGVQVEGGYGLKINETWKAKPFLGIKRTKSQRDAYTETSGADFAMSYQAVESRTTTLYAGSEFSGKITQEVTLMTRLGAEQDLSSSTSDYTSRADYLGEFTLKAPKERKNRGFASIGAEYNHLKNNIISISVSATEQLLNNNGVGYTMSASYSFGW